MTTKIQNNKKVTLQAKMLNLAAEEAEIIKNDLKLKRNWLVNLKNLKQFSSTIRKLSEDLTKLISEGFNMEHMMFQPITTKGKT